MAWKNKKSGDIYYFVGTVINATNDRLGQMMVEYTKGGIKFVREENEFYEKFERVPNTCTICGTTENLWFYDSHGYRCNSAKCAPY